MRIRNLIKALRQQGEFKTLLNHILQSVPADISTRNKGRRYYVDGIDIDVHPAMYNILEGLFYGRISGNFTKHDPAQIIRVKLEKTLKSKRLDAMYIDIDYQTNGSVQFAIFFKE